ncbi:DMT family transporter [Tropicimonas sp. S265A]|uniref:DMT family transporter n=1 Tax=Tropicimonas sp. S265A TaxID=3415134 RepID=UPI003C7CC43F
MTGPERVRLTAVLVAIGAGWGITQPLSKIAVSTGHPPFGLVFWQLAIGAVVLGAICVLRGRGLPLGPVHLRLYGLVALVGTLIPNTASYAAIAHLPSGIVSILLSLVPMLAFPIALVLGLDRFSALRLGGLACGLAGVALIVLPGSGALQAVALVWIPVALIAPLFYAVEGNIVARWGTYGLDPLQVLWGASLVGAVLALPVTLITGVWVDPRPPWGGAEAALVASSVIHGLVYASYVWLVGRAGPVFAGQAAYLVTGFGLIWAMLLLSERYSGPVWAALVLMCAGLFLVQPRRNAALAKPAPPAQTASSER